MDTSLLFSAILVDWLFSGWMFHTRWPTIWYFLGSGRSSCYLVCVFGGEGSVVWRFRCWVVGVSIFRSSSVRNHRWLVPPHKYFLILRSRIFLPASVNLEEGMNRSYGGNHHEWCVTGQVFLKFWQPPIFFLLLPDARVLFFRRIAHGELSAMR